MPERRKRDSNRHTSSSTLDLLTPREREVLSAVARGLTNRQTAEALGISHRTVEVHRARLMRKLEVHSVAQLVALYIRTGIASPKTEKNSSM